MKFLHVLFGLMLTLCSAVTFAQAVDINTASAQQLDKALKGIGPAKAAAIVKYRETNGPFQSVDDLTKVPGIKDKSLEKLLKDNKQMLTVGGAAAVPATPAAAVPAAPVMPAAPKAPATPAAPAMPATPPVPAAPVKQP
ncbi:MAG: helix-hairpin-helix domain-containing protein [Candidatus Contendobacter sp.]|nr:helix-hairpin-helix domain-containing protein [Candidatus Contendobacter sp.]